MSSNTQPEQREPQTPRAPLNCHPEREKRVEGPASCKSGERVGDHNFTPTPIDSELAWKQLLARDSGAEFLYAVSTTGVFCRPSCTSRRPLRANVRFFRTADEACAAGFRPCKRCRPTSIASSSPLNGIRAHLEANLDRAVPLAELARLVRLSPFTVQRMFKREMGVSPLQYQRALRATSLRGTLKQGGTVTNAIYNAGFSSSSRARTPNAWINSHATENRRPAAGKF